MTSFKASDVLGQKALGHFFRSSLATSNMPVHMTGGVSEIGSVAVAWSGLEFQ